MKNLVRVFLTIHYYYVIIFFPRWVENTKWKIKEAVLQRDWYNTYAKSRLGIDYSDMLYWLKHRIRKSLRMQDDIHFHGFFEIFKTNKNTSEKAILRYLCMYRLIRKK